jgi:hypothetical protein
MRCCIYDTNHVSAERSKYQVTISEKTTIYIQTLSYFVKIRNVKHDNPGGSETRNDYFVRLRIMDES